MVWTTKWLRPNWASTRPRCRNGGIGSWKSDWRAWPTSPVPASTEVRRWDTTDLSPIFLLAKLVLLQDDGAALAMIGDLLASGDLARTELATWPLFAGLRSQGLLDRYLAAGPEGS
jgi:hypothetical protein